MSIYIKAVIKSSSSIMNNLNTKICLSKFYGDKHEYFKEIYNLIDNIINEFINRTFIKNYDS